MDAMARLVQRYKLPPASAADCLTQTMVAYLSLRCVGLSYKEIAKACYTSPQVVYNAISQARKRLADHTGRHVSSPMMMRWCIKIGLDQGLAPLEDVGRPPTVAVARVTASRIEDARTAATGPASPTSGRRVC